MKIREALTFDDVLLQPARSAVLPADTIIKTRLTRSLELNIPLISAAMDTVTEHRLAITMAQAGGIGVVHKNLTIEEQAAEIAAYADGVIVGSAFVKAAVSGGSQAVAELARDLAGGVRQTR